MQIMIMAAALLAIEAAAPTEPVSVFGIRLLEPISVPECGTFTDPLKYRKKYAGYPYAEPTVGACYWRDDRAKAGTSEPLVYENIEIHFPPNAAPELGYGVTALMLDGKVQAVRWLTHGAGEQNAVLAALSQKFGRPDAVTADAKQNGFGARFDSLRASWHPTHTLTVVFQGTTDRVDLGDVIVMSEAARARTMQDASRQKQNTPM